QRRLRDIWDAWTLLARPPETTPVRAFHVWFLWPALGLCLGLVALWIWWRQNHPGAVGLQPVARLVVDLGNNLPPGTGHGADVILSSDGRRLAYISQSRLFTRLLV